TFRSYRRFLLRARQDLRDVHRPQTRAQAPAYRFFSFDDEFPGLAPVDVGGWSVPGEIYEVSYAELREKLLPREPDELELSVIELEDGRGSLSMVCRSLPLVTDSAREITTPGGWRAYLAAAATA
ncbi:hypothetical protein, partial [Streptomyces sp. NPDC018347]|uniref:allophanate hydrolase-related protein n=1 Tax=Streptomyces sp. NPDC018347 TaxID=3157193 RepID=UPI00340EB170